MTFVIFFMGQDMTNIHTFCLIHHDGNKSDLVPANIEYMELSNSRVKLEVRHWVLNGTFCPGKFQFTHLSYYIDTIEEKGMSAVIG